MFIVPFVFVGKFVVNNISILHRKATPTRKAGVKTNVRGGSYY
jgi:hypothetical protein